jgi:hypothetical protein
MSGKTRFIRFLAGFALLLVILAAGFQVALSIIPTWGATAEEAAQALPGDEQLTAPLTRWVNAVTIDAPLGQVWPWIIQIGDSRGGYYSYMFIEKAFMAALRDPAFPPSDYYNNAALVHAAWQNPPIGQGVILDYVNLVDYQPNRYMLAAADSERMGGLGWTWLWYVTPTADGRTRLVVHLRIQPPVIPGAPDSPALGAAVDLSAFVMQKKMIDGIRLRAEGGGEPAWVQPVEIVLWLALLLTGLAAGWRYLTRPSWQIPLAVALGAVVGLFVFTFIQPALWLRVLILLAALAALARDAGVFGQYEAAKPPHIA